MPHRGFSTFRLENWYESVKHLTFDTIVIKLEYEEANMLLKFRDQQRAYFQHHKGTFVHDAAHYRAMMNELVEKLSPEHQKCLEALRSRLRPPIEDYVKSFGGAFVKVRVFHTNGLSYRAKIISVSSFILLQLNIVLYSSRLVHQRMRQWSLTRSWHSSRNKSRTASIAVRLSLSHSLHSSFLTPLYSLHLSRLPSLTASLCRIGNDAECEAAQIENMIAFTRAMSAALKVTSCEEALSLLMQRCASMSVRVCLLIMR